MKPLVKKAFSNTDLIVAWREFAKMLPEQEVAMAQRLDILEPQLQEDGQTALVIVDNSIVVSQMEAYIPKIESYLRQRLQNNEIAIATKIREATDRRRTYSRAEQYNMLLEQSEELRKLKDVFELELS